MLHKPTQRKLPKKYDNAQKVQQEKLNKAGSKPLMRGVSNTGNGARTNNQRQASVKGQVAKVQQKLQSINGKLNNTQLQTLLIQQIKGIKNELKEIKQHIGINSTGKKQYPSKHQEQQEQDESIYAIQNNRNSRLNKVQEIYEPIVQKEFQLREQPSQSRHLTDRSRTNNYKLVQKPKELIDVGKIQPYMKEFKIQVSKTLMPYYHGYHKKSSKPVIIKYCPENRSMEPIFNLYERLWKNIVKAKHICINKVYDINEPLANYILVIEANKYSLEQILRNRIATVSQILCSILQALQFFHECGYLYRNLHPSHVMYSYQNEIVLVDLKNMKRFVDIKGKHMAVTRDNNELDDQFISNSRARGLKQGRKDDLQSLGYLALYIIQGSLPWTVNNLVQVRSKLTLKELCGRYPGLLEFMIAIAQMQTQDVPDYARLSELLSKI